MPICKGCGGSYDNNFQFCPYCGRETPKAQAPETVLKETPLINACPVCQRNDRVEKVSIIYKGGRRETSMSVPVTNVETDSKGRTYSSTSYETVGGLSQTSLSEELQPPVKPEYKKPVGFFGTLMVVSMLYIPYLIILFIFEIFGFDMLFFVYAGLVLIPVITIFWHLQNKKEDAIESAQFSNVSFPAFERSIEIWKSLYFCHRDGVVFVPGKNKSFPLEKLAEIYQN